MTEKQLIAKIQELRQIKPRKDWVVLTKNSILNQGFRRAVPTESRIGQILGEERPSFSFISFIRELQKGERFIFQHKPAFAAILTLAILVGLFGFAQNSLPGDTLFPIKKITERSQAVFVSESQQPKRNLELAIKRLDDLTKIAETNSVKKLASAINEFQASVSRAAESLAEREVKEDHQIVREIVLEVRELEEKTEKIKSLGIEIGESEELGNALAKIVEREVEELEERTLTEKQGEILTGVKEDYQNKDYSQALEKILFLVQ